MQRGCRLGDLPNERHSIDRKTGFRRLAFRPSCNWLLFRWKPATSRWSI